MIGKQIKTDIRGLVKVAQLSFIQIQGEQIRAGIGFAYKDPKTGAELQITGGVPSVIVVEGSGAPLPEGHGADEETVKRYENGRRIFNEFAAAIQPFVDNLIDEVTADQ